VEVILQSRTGIALLGNTLGQSQWPYSLMLRSAAARLLELWVRIPPAAGTLWEFCIVRYRSLASDWLLVQN